MEEFSKDKTILNGKGEQDTQWITVNGNHIPLKDGETPKQAIEKRFDKKKAEPTNDTDKKQSIDRLVKILKEVKKIKLKELVDMIIGFEPINLKTNDKELLAEFDKFSAKKNIYTKGLSDSLGYDYKLTNINNLPNYIKGTSYDYSLKEKGKQLPQHKGVKEWHYFTGKVQTEKGNFNIVVNIRDKGLSQYVYEISFRKEKT